MTTRSNPSCRANRTPTTVGGVSGVRVISTDLSASGKSTPVGEADGGLDGAAVGDVIVVAGTGLPVASVVVTGVGEEGTADGVLVPPQPTSRARGARARATRVRFMMASCPVRCPAPGRGSPSGKIRFDAALTRVRGGGDT
ncbi:hypothetical protein GCM10017600_88460 [Streptosporangium carneum]|uniref:Uncharacterized protein n=1 Tax=Streptosporangium carneum TaxID=47481 RepID=A0A9W6MIX1_9ACTN|nr:hypothetical protein GCM10017600_88460 [Streptosporangium carneum]